MISINRNVTIVVIILVLVVIAGYLIWLRSRYQPPVSPQVETPKTSVEPTASPQQSASPSATPGAKEATGSMKEKTSTSGGTSR